MEDYGNVGRIPRQSFMVSTTLLFALALISVFARYCIRIGVQREFSLDDAFLTFGTFCLIAAMVVLYINMDNMYLTEAMVFTPPTEVTLPPAAMNQILNRVYEFRKLVTASLILTWVALMSVKFSFLALFRRLIDRMPPLIKYWRVVVAFNVAVTAYGAAVYVIACPEFSGPEVVTCLGGHTTKKTVHYALSQLVLDVFGDLLILYIPVQLIWKVKIKRGQKLTLACSLCLTAVVVVFTITRASGLEWQGKLDVLWEVYFQIVAAEVGLILVSMTAFRALFVSRAAKHQHSPPKALSLWWCGKISLKKLLDPCQWTSKPPRDTHAQPKHASTEDGFDLPNIPGGTMTGIRTFINDQGQHRWSDVETVGYPQTVQEPEHTLPLSSTAPRREQKNYDHHFASGDQLTGPRGTCACCDQAVPKDLT